jgi:PTS system glucitol/sorbitol-specific IIC component
MQMNILVNFATWFIGLFQAGAATFTGLVTGIIPIVIVLMTAFNALIALIGSERVDRLAKAAGRPGFLYTPIRFLILPVVADFILTNPMAYTMGRFLPEKNKPAFYDAAVSFVHPPLGIFPHINPGELFVWLGIAAGVQQGYGTPAMTQLAVLYISTGFVVIYIRGLACQFLTNRTWNEEAAAAASAE